MLASEAFLSPPRFREVHGERTHCDSKLAGAFGIVAIFVVQLFQAIEQPVYARLVQLESGTTSSAGNRIWPLTEEATQFN